MATEQISAKTFLNALLCSICLCILPAFNCNELFIAALSGTAFSLVACFVCHLKL